MKAGRTSTGTPAPSRAGVGFTLLEVLIAVAILALVLVGAGRRGGVLDGLRDAQIGIRMARDYTVAGAYLQSLHEFVASRGGDRVGPGAYCVGPGCEVERALPSGLDGYPLPPATPSQLDWRRLEVVIEPWAWDRLSRRFAPGEPGELWRVRSSLTWQFGGTARTLVLERFVR